MEVAEFGVHDASHYREEPPVDEEEGDPHNHGSNGHDPEDDSEDPEQCVEEP